MEEIRINEEWVAHTLGAAVKPVGEVGLAPEKVMLICVVFGFLLMFAVSVK